MLLIFCRNPGTSIVAPPKVGTNPGLLLVTAVSSLLLFSASSCPNLFSGFDFCSQAFAEASRPRGEGAAFSVGLDSPNVGRKRRVLCKSYPGRRLRNSNAKPI